MSGTGFDFADFLLGVPDTSAIAFGNADKYLRESSTTPTSPTIGACAAGLHPELGRALGIQRAHHRALRPAGEPGYHARVSPAAPVVAAIPPARSPASATRIRCCRPIRAAGSRASGSPGTRSWDRPL